MNKALAALRILKYLHSFISFLEGVIASHLLGPYLVISVSTYVSIHFHLLLSGLVMLPKSGENLGQPFWRGLIIGKVIRMCRKPSLILSGVSYPLPDQLTLAILMFSLIKRKERKIRE